MAFAPGYKDINDAERLCLDPALRTVVGGRAKANMAASASEMARFEAGPIMKGARRKKAQCGGFRSPQPAAVSKLCRENGCQRSLEQGFILRN
jgi:hypothetical protein